MYLVSDKFLKQIKADNREFSVKLTFNSSTELTGTTIQNIAVDEIVNSADVLTLGCACSNKITIKLINAPRDIDYENSFFTAKVGLKLGEMPTVYEDVPLGKFYVTDAETQNDFKNLTITAYDGFSKMAGNYIPSMSEEETTTLQALYNDLKAQLLNNFGIVLKSMVCPAFEMTVPNIEKLSYQQAVGYLAGCLGGFARFDRMGELEIVPYTDSGIVVERNVQYMNGFKRLTEKPLLVTSIVTGTKENAIAKGDGANGTEINFENPYITDAMAEKVYNDYNRTSYTPCQLKWRGNPAIQAGDIITVLDNDDVPQTVFVMSQSIKIGGGMNSTVECKGKSATTSNFSKNFETSSQKIDKVYKQLTQKIIDATNAITGNSGGYVVLNDTNNDGKPDEILIMDYENIETATKVWRWNKAGLGYAFNPSGNAYLGPYRTAITAEGEINADFVTVGTLSAERIAVEQYDDKTGLLTDYIHFENGEMIFGETGSALKLKLENEQVAFYYDDRRIAYFSSNSFEIENLTDGKIRFQTFGFVPRASGNLSFTKLV
jgi:hypothetical protein